MQAGNGCIEIGQRPGLKAAFEHEVSLDPGVAQGILDGLLNQAFRPLG